MDHAARMRAERLYSPLDEGLTAERTRARGLTRRYNATLETELAERAAILAELFGTLGPDSEIEPPFYCDYGYNIHAGTCFYANFGCVILDCAEVRFGNDVLLAPYVQLFTAWHPTQPEVRASKLEYASPISIGDNVWLGGGTIVCPGVNIGDNTSIGAGSVVTKDIPSDVVAAGNPCRVIRPAR